MPEDGEHLFEHPSFYAEFAPLEDYSGFIGFDLYSERPGTADCKMPFIASPLRELTFGTETLRVSNITAKLS